MGWIRRNAVVFPIFLLLVSILLSGQAFATGSDRIVFVRGGNIWIAHTNGSQERQLTFTGQDGSPSLSPDGKWVLYHSGKDKYAGFGQLYLLSTEGGVPKKFDIKGIQAAQDPFFSFDGNSFVFVGISNTRIQPPGGDVPKAHATMSICTVDLLNLKLKTVVSNPVTQVDGNYVYDAPSCSPDFSLISFQHNSGDGSGGFEVVDSRGKFLFRYPKEPWDPAPYWRPRFSPDGTHVLCYTPSTSESSPDTVYMVDIKKGKKKKVIEGANPTFVEGGKAIVFEMGNGHWSTGAKPDLFYMKLGPNCSPPKKIISNGSQPSD
jgi:Tol biopolymer transport system component